MLAMYVQYICIHAYIHINIHTYIHRYLLQIKAQSQSNSFDVTLFQRPEDEEEDVPRGFVFFAADKVYVCIDTLALKMYDCVNIYVYVYTVCM